ESAAEFFAAKMTFSAYVPALTTTVHGPGSGRSSMAAWILRCVPPPAGSTMNSHAASAEGGNTSNTLTTIDNINDRPNKSFFTTASQLRGVIALTVIDNATPRLHAVRHAHLDRSAAGPAPAVGGGEMDFVDASVPVAGALGPQ